MFSRKVLPATPNTNSDTPMVKMGDQLSDQVVILGTTYRTGNLVVCKAFSPDLLQMGEIIKVVLRKNNVMFLVMLSEALRNPLGIFESLPSEEVTLVTYNSLWDYKPLIKRADNSTYPFVLHHHICSPPYDDDELLSVVKPLKSKKCLFPVIS